MCVFVYIYIYTKQIDFNFKSNHKTFNGPSGSKTPVFGCVGTSGFSTFPRLWLTIFTGFKAITNPHPPLFPDLFPSVTIKVTTKYGVCHELKRETNKIRVIFYMSLYGGLISYSVPPSGLNHRALVSAKYRRKMKDKCSGEEDHNSGTYQRKPKV